LGAPTPTLRFRLDPFATELDQRRMRVLGNIILVLVLLGLLGLGGWFVIRALGGRRR
jgi:hypothetical protein